MKEKVTLRPLSKRVIVEVEKENPHRRKQTASGIIIPESNLTHALINKEQEGIVEGGEQRIKYGVVQEVAIDCNLNVCKGDQIVFDNFASLPVALGIEELRIIPETAILYILDIEHAS